MDPRFHPGHGGGDGGAGFDHGRGFGWLLLGLFVRFVFIGLVVAGALLLAQRLFGRPRGHRHGPPGPPRSPALHELELRYARGEVPRDEYLERRLDLLAAAGGVAYGAPPPGAPVPGSMPPSAGPPPPATSP